MCARNRPDVSGISFDVLLCAACNSIEEITTRNHRSSILKRDGHDCCVLCSHQIAKFKQGRPHEGGRAHDTCVRRLKRTVVATSCPSLRAKRPYQQLQHTQRWERRIKARAAVTTVLKEIDCPLEAIIPTATITPSEIVHLSTAERNRTRSIRKLLFASERTVRRALNLYAVSHATETVAFSDGAYMSDPLRYVSYLCGQSTFLAVGGDCGGGHCKLGVTYSHNGKQHFAALLVYDGGD